MKKCLTLILFFAAFSLNAQTAAELDTLLENAEVSAATAARFVLASAALVPEDLSGEAAETAAFEMAVSKGWLTRGAADSVTLRDTAFLVMNAFELKGGIMYSLFHNPRYAYRETVYRKIIRGRADPAMTVSGIRLLQIIDSALAFSGGDQ